MWDNKLNDELMMMDSTVCSRGREGTNLNEMLLLHTSFFIYVAKWCLLTLYFPTKLNFNSNHSNLKISLFYISFQAALADTAAAAGEAEHNGGIFFKKKNIARYNISRQKSSI